ncbi:MAG TPA: response regulator [Pseudolabrys sp.]|jgi:DNA-binding response OmpR family regulator|nr:response regulator [Pseudolabrys sp.]
MIRPPQECSILIVEDETLLAMDVETMVSDAGYRVLGPVTSIAEAMRVASTSVIDAAILDINLQGQPVFPLADILASSSIPFVVLSGHQREMLPERHRDRPFIQKPYRVEELLAALKELFSEKPEKDGLAKSA